MTLKLAFLPWFALSILSGLALADGPPDDATLSGGHGIERYLSRSAGTTDLQS